MRQKNAQNLPPPHVKFLPAVLGVLQIRRARKFLRSATKETTTKLDMPRRMLLEKVMEWTEKDELVGAAPQSILDDLERHKSGREA